MTPSRNAVPGLGERLSAARRALGLTQADAAARIGATPADVCRYESEALVPSVRRLALLADAYGVSTDELLGRTTR